MRKSNQNHGYHGHFASAPEYSIYPQPMDASRLLPKCKNPNDKKEQRQYIDLFMQQFGGTFEKAVSFTDASGKKLNISPRMFKDRNKKGYKIFKNGREQYLLMLAEAIKNPTEIWEDTKKGGNTAIRKYVATYRLGNERVSGVIVFDLMNGRWEGTTAHQRKSPDTVRNGNLIYTAEGIKKSRLLCQSSGPLPELAIKGARTCKRLNQNISPPKNEFNKSLRSGLWLRKGLNESFGSSEIAETAAHCTLGRRTGVNGEISSTVRLKNVKVVDDRLHNTLQKSESPSDSIKPQAQNDILAAAMYLLKSGESRITLRKSQMAFDFNAHDHHVAYTRTSKNGVVSQIQQKGAPHKIYHAGADIPSHKLNDDTYWTHDKDAAEKGYLGHRPEANKLHEAEFHGDKPAGDDVVIKTAKRLGFDEDDLELYTPASAFDKTLFPAKLVDKLKDELRKQGYSHIEATDITPPGDFQKEFKAVIPLVPVKHLSKSFCAEGLLQITKSNGGEYGTDGRAEVRKESGNAEASTGGSGRDGQEGCRESEICKSQAEDGQVQAEGRPGQGSSGCSSTSAYAVARKAGAQAFMLRKSRR